MRISVPAMPLARRPLGVIAAFAGVGLAGLATDAGLFTLLHGFGSDALAARLASLSAATLVTWRLNRHFTFGKPGFQRSGDPARYAIVTLAAQGLSFTIFALLTLLVPRLLPQLALFTGAAIAAAASFEGHRLYSFATRSGQDTR